MSEEVIKKYYDNPEVKEKLRLKYLQNKERIKEYNQKPEVKEKQREYQKKYRLEHKKEPKREKHWVMSEESKNKISKANRFHEVKELVRKRISEKLKGRPSPNKGNHYSEETRKKMSERLKGRKVTWGYKIGLANKGRKHTEETKQKMRKPKKSNLGYLDRWKRIQFANLKEEEDDFK